MKVNSKIEKKNSAINNKFSSLSIVVLKHNLAMCFSTLIIFWTFLDFTPPLWKQFPAWFFGSRISAVDMTTTEQLSDHRIFVLEKITTQKLM